MKHFTTYLAGLTLFAVTSPVAAQSTDPIYDLTERDTFNSCTQFSLDYDHDSYDVWAFSNYDSCPVMYNYNLTEPYYSDYLLTGDIALESGCLYRMVTAPAAYTNEKTGNLTIAIGQGNSMSAYTVLEKYEDFPYAKSADAEEREFTFSVAESGNYKIYFLGKGNAIKLCKTKIYKEGTSAVPMGVSDLQVLPATDGSAEATVMFTMPSSTISGQIIDGQLKYSIYRNDEETAIKNGRANAGESVSYTDTNVEIGMVTYKVVVISGEETSAPVAVSTYVGPETPEAVTGLTMNQTGNVFSLSWTAPQKGIHGALLNPELLSYNVYRIVDGTPEVIANNLTATTYSDTYVSSELHVVSYSVTAVFNNVESEEVKTSSVTVGSLALPFADSFAGASFAGGWTTEIVSGSGVYNWQAVATNPQPSQSPKVTEAYDGDGGFAFFNSWSAQAVNQARLITPPLRHSATDNPVVEFYLCHSANAKDGVKIQISADGGEWIDLPNALAPVKGETLVWEKYSFPIADIIPEGTSSYRVALLTDNQYGHNIVVDKVRVFSLMNHDLEATLLTAPEAVMAGNNINLSFSVVNNGASDVASDGYSMEMVSDFPVDVELPATVAIPSLGAATYNVTLPLTAAEAREAESYSFALKVNYAGDENESNNLSATAEVATAFSEKDAPSDPRIEKMADGSLSLSWTHAGDPTYVPVNESTSFEDFEDGFTGPFDGFVSLDLDGKDGGTYYSASGSAFKVIKSNSYPSGRNGSSCIGLSLAANAQQNDWLISPELNCPAGSTMNLSFLIGVRKFSSSSYYYNFEVVYSTEEYDPENPTETFSHVIAKKTSSTSYGDFLMNESLYKMTFSDIPAEAKYVALHFTTKMSLASALWLDDIHITENIEQPLLGYHVYEHGVSRVNEEIIPSTDNSYLVPSMNPALRAANRDEDRKFFVTAVYPEGESQPTVLTSIETGVAEIEAATGEAVYYDLQGVRVAVPSQGIYIRVRNGKTDKVIVR